jgi:hypothetical protein
MNPDRNDPLPAIPTHWSPEEALAVHDFLADILEAIWEAYGDDMSELLHGEIEQEKNDPPEPFDFNDPLPF